MDDAPEAEPELGYRLRKEAWGKGYAPETSQAIVDRGFSEYDISRVFASAYAQNRSSTRAMQKLGMKVVRSFRDHPKDGISVEYAIDRTTWKQLNESTATQ